MSSRLTRSDEPPYGHRPRYVGGAARVDVAELEISQAFYGVMPTGRRVDFDLSATPDKPAFRLHVGLLAPALGVRGPNRAQARLRADVRWWTDDGLAATPTALRMDDARPFWEPFSRRLYWEARPDYNRVVRARVAPNRVTVSGPAGARYVLAVGDVERFEAADVASARTVLSRLDALYFEGPSPPDVTAATEGAPSIASTSPGATARTGSSTGRGAKAALTMAATALLGLALVSLALALALAGR